SISLVNRNPPVAHDPGIFRNVAASNGLNREHFHLRESVMRSILACLAVCVACTGVRADENEVAVTGLIGQLKSPDSDLRRDAAKKIGELGKDGKKATAALVTAVKSDKDLFVRRFAAQALGQIEADPKVAVPALRTLMSEEKELMEAAIGSLGKMGAAAVPALVDALKKDGSQTKPKGNKKGPQTPDRTAFLRAKAAQALGQLGPDAKSAVPALIEALRDASVRIDAATALGDIGPEAKKAVGALRDAIGAKGAKRDKEFTKAVNEAIRKIEKS